MFILDPVFYILDPGSRVKRSRGMFTPNLDFFPSWIPDLGVKKAPDPGSGFFPFPDPGIKKAPDSGSAKL
jgi:hypothetical protein